MSLRTTIVPLSLALAAVGAASPEATAAAPAPLAPQSADRPAAGPVFRVATIGLSYVRENPAQPPLDEIRQVRIGLTRTATGWAAPGPNDEVVERTLAEWSDAPADDYHASALQRMLEAVRDAFVARDLLGIYVIPDPRQITETGTDLRQGTADLDLVVTTGVVTAMRTVAGGERVAEGGEISPEERIDHPRHARILADSPVRPWTGDPADPRADLLRRAELDRYVYFLARHPGRRVDVALAPAAEVGGTTLDYLVTENRPLIVYGQVSNTGTSATGYWRERVGLLHTQLTNNDDILSLDYQTNGFDGTDAVQASYDAPFANRRVRWNVRAGWDQYDAQDIGIFDDDFTGESWHAAAEVRWNFFQKRELFVDLVGGVRYDDYTATNEAFDIEGNEQFLTPYVGLAMDATAEWYSTRAAAVFEWQPDLLDADEDEVEELGRTDPDTDWTVLRFSGSHSFYLEPVLNRAAWEDPTTPESSTLAHEIQLSVSGQWAFSDRLIPQEEAVIGGLYTVRGYPQSIAAGDSSIVASAEYRYHLPRAFNIRPEPNQLFGEPFRVAPQYVYGVPDWDLVLKGFVDVGRTDINDAFSFEDGETLVGAGVGVEFAWKRNVQIRVDWGFALDELEGLGVADGANRLHFLATLLF